jgi:POLQ-like helicase
LQNTDSDIDIILTDELGNKVLLRNRIEELKSPEIIDEAEHIIKNYPDLFIS